MKKMAICTSIVVIFLFTLYLTQLITPAIIAGAGVIITATFFMFRDTEKTIN